MDKNKIITIAVIAGGGYLLYWYLTSYGPKGAVTGAGQSYWDQWFSGAAAPAQSNTATVLPAAGTITAPVNTTPATSTAANPATQTDPANIVAQAAPMRDSLLAYVNSDMGTTGSGTQLNYDQWSYYIQRMTGKTITPQLFGAILGNSDRSTTITVDQFLAALATALSSNPSGMGDIVPSPIRMSSGLGNILPTASIENAVPINMTGRRPAVKRSSPWGNIPAISARKEYIN